MKNKGFTLAELLIALAILGVIATFTIPKVLNTAGSSQNTAIAKEVAGMISGAQQAYSQSNTIVATTTPADFTQFMNYVKVETVNDLITGTGAAATCATATPCLILHSGGVLQYTVANSFGTINNTAALLFYVDPDAAGVATPVTFVQFRNGRLTTGGNQACASATCETSGGGTVITPDPSYIQSWN